MNPLLGTWTLKSCLVTADSGETSTPYGANPIGYLSYSADGRMYAIGTSSERGAPFGGPTEDERIALYETMFAYAGTYSMEADRVTHHVDVSWNEVWRGTDQVRFYDLNENVLTITAHVSQPTAQYVLVWEKVTGREGPNSAKSLTARNP